MLDELERDAPRRDNSEAVVDAVAVAHVDAPVVDVGELPLTQGIDNLPLEAEVPDRGAVALFENPRVEAPSRRGRFAAIAAAAAVVLLLLVPQFVDRARLWPGTGSDLVNTPQSASSNPSSSAPDSATAVPQREQAVADATEAQPAPPQRDVAVPTVGTPPVVAAAKEIPADDVRTAEAAPAIGLSDAESSWSPSFASVGTAMFYHVEGERGSALMRADRAGEGTTLRITRIVDDNARNFHARPSPDATQIAFDSDRDGERGVYIANADGTNVRRVSGEGFAAVPSWSPDGETLVFVRAEPGRPKVWNLWRLDVSSGDMERLTSHRYGQMMGASWFPDNRHLAYSHELRLVVLDTQTGRERSYQTPRKGKLVRTPAVSPDGQLIILQVLRDGAWLLDLEDGSMRKVLADPTAEEYSWSPDGRRVAYHSRRSGEWGVWLMSAVH